MTCSVVGAKRRGLLETENALKKSPETAKPQEISSKTGNRNKRHLWKSIGRLQNFSFFNLIFTRINVYFSKFFLRIPHPGRPILELVR